MDPTLNPNNQQGMQGNPQAAIQNAMILHALQNGGGGATPPMPATDASVGPQQMGEMGQVRQSEINMMQPTDPSTMTGGMGATSMQGIGQVPLAQIQQLQQSNPIAAALMSQIPGGSQ